MDTTTELYIADLEETIENLCSMLTEVSLNIEDEATLEDISYLVEGAEKLIFKGLDTYEESD
jgi:hypothetical protein